MSRDNHLRSRSPSRSISRYRNNHYNNAIVSSKSNRPSPPLDGYRMRNESSPSAKRSRYQRERSHSDDRNGHRSSKRKPSPTDIRRKNMTPSRVLGVFNMHVRTTESEIREVFDRFGKIEEIIMVKDSKTRGFRGYCFIYFKHEREATAALNQCNGMELKERTIRVDYSLSARPHSPTPGRNFGSYRGKRGRSPMMRRDFHDRRDSFRDRRPRSAEKERSYRKRSPSFDRKRSPSFDRSENKRKSPAMERHRSRSREYRRSISRERHRYRS